MPSKLGFTYEILGRKDYDVVMGVSFGMLIFSSSRGECEKHYDSHKSNNQMRTLNQAMLAEKV